VFIEEQAVADIGPVGGRGFLFHNVRRRSSLLGHPGDSRRPIKNKGTMTARPIERLIKLEQEIRAIKEEMRGKLVGKARTTMKSFLSAKMTEGEKEKLAAAVGLTLAFGAERIPGRSGLPASERVLP